MEGCLPCVNGNNGNMLVMSFHFLITKMEGCPPFHCILQMKMIEGSLPCFSNKWWKDAYRLSMEVMEICLPFHSIRISYPPQINRYPSEINWYPSKINGSPSKANEFPSKMKKGCVAGLLGCWVAGLLDCWVAGLLGCWIPGLLGCWVAGLLACWLAGLLGCWIVA